MKRKPFIRGFWYKKRIEFPTLTKNLIDYFDNSYISVDKDMEVLFKIKNAYPGSIKIIFTNKIDNSYKIICIEESEIVCDFCDSYYLSRGSIEYKDSEKKHFYWPIENFKTWPKEIKTFTLKFIKLLEQSYYKYEKEQEIKESTEKKFKDALKEEELVGVLDFFRKINERTKDE